MSFRGLAFDSDTSTTDYAFRADVTGANACEGGGLGRTRYFYKVDDDPEVRSGTVSASCPAGDLHHQGHHLHAPERRSGSGDGELYGGRARPGANT